MFDHHRPTPGPWRVFTAFKDLEIVTDRPTAQATESIVQFKGQAHAAANATLMAASPEMRDALELCVDALTTLARLDDGTCSVSALIRALEALRKAQARPG